MMIMKKINRHGGDIKMTGKAFDAEYKYYHRDEKTVVDSHGPYSD